MRIKTITIREPFFGAGSPKMFNWIKDGYGIIGIGVKVSDVANNDKLIIKLKDSTYEVSTDQIKEIHAKYKSIYRARNLVELVVFPKSIMIEKYE